MIVTSTLQKRNNLIIIFMDALRLCVSCIVPVLAKSP